MWNKIREFLTIPPAIRPEFWQECVQKNWTSLGIISVLIFGMQLYNIVRVLFWTNAKLGTLNNRIYFTLYCTLLLGAALFLLLKYLLRTAPLRKQWITQAIGIGFFLLWHVGFNAYDLARTSTSGTYTFVIALMGLAIFINMSSLYSALYFSLGYVLFMVLSAPCLDLGIATNLTMTAIVALAVSLTRSHYAVEVLVQRREINRINAQLHQLLQKDPLTGLLNKKAVQNYITCSLETASPSECQALLMADLDDFKEVNDHYGHPCGDHVLEEMARRLQQVFPEAQCIGRVGGDEFVVFHSGGGDAGALERRGDQLIQALSDIQWAGERLKISCSVGIIRACRPGVPYERLYEQADQALYEAKRQGKGRCCLRESS